jgi:hypothetical protein
MLTKDHFINTGKHRCLKLPRRPKLAFLFLSCAIFLCGFSARAQKSPEKYRVVIMTDMTHDDGNSLIRYLYYSPYFDTEAIIVTQQLPDFNYNQDGPWQKVQSIITAYQQEYDQLKKHHPDFITYDQLNRITKPGRGALPIIWLTNEKKFASEIAGRYVESSWGDIRFADWIGEGTNPNGESKDSEGSEYLQQIFAKDDDRPIFVQMWGGPVTFVQALYRYRQRQGEAKFGQLLKKLHLFGILYQDITFDFFVDLDKTQALKCANMGTVQSTYTGERVQPGWLLHDTGHFWKYIKVMQQSEVNGHGPMSDIYDHGGEGDTPAFLYLLSGVFGLNNPLEPTQGSWGSRFVSMGEQFPDNYFHTCGVEQTELERWIPHAKNSFMNRLQYSTKNPDEVNHEPLAVVNGDKTNRIIHLKAKPGKAVRLNASASSDPDGNQLSFHWYQYPEAGNYPGKLSIANPATASQTVTIPRDIGDKQIHLILEVHDNGTPSLVTYRRVILSGKE